MSAASSSTTAGGSRGAARLGLAVLSLFLLALPLGVPKPGLPSTLKADEPAYLLMALSLVHDRDVRCEVKDLHRLFAEYPFAPTHNLVLTSADGWRTVYFGKPFVYPLFAAPFAALLGSNGLLLFNMLLFVAMIWMGAVHLRRSNGEGLAALFSAAFFLLSVAWTYVFWLQPEIFNMASVAASLFVGLGSAPWPAARSKSSWGARAARLGPALAGALLALGAYNKPMLLIFGLPVWARAFVGATVKERLWAAARRAVEWGAGTLAMLAVLTAISLALTGQPSPYLGGERAGHEVYEPDRMPVEPTAAGSVDDDARGVAEATAATPVAAAPAKPRRTWWWIFRVPDVPLRELFENLLYFLVGRHTGVLLYMPFALLATMLFALRGPRPPEGWGLLAAVVGLAGFFLLWIPFNWHGGGGFVGNRYFVNGYPAFLFLVGTIAPRWLFPATTAWASVFLGTLVVSPFGRPVPFPTLQAHVRADVFRLFPLELSLRGIPGYLRTAAGDLGLMARRDQVLPRGEVYWIHGATPVELWLQSTEPIEELVLQLRSPARGNSVGLSIGEARERLELSDDDWHRVSLRPVEVDRTRVDEGKTLWVYRLLIDSDWGEVQKWTAEYPPPKADYFAYQASSEESFFVGVELRILGTAADLGRDVFVATWEKCDFPRSAEDQGPGRVTAGSEITIPATLRNASPHAWPSKGATRVALSYHWKRTDVAEAEGVWDGERTPLARDLPAGQSIETAIQVRVPTTPGAWELSLDAVREEVGWFSERGVTACRSLLTVAAGAEPPSP